MKLRFKDLKLGWRGTWLAGCLRELNQELAEKGIPVRPHALAVERMVQPRATRRASPFRSIWRIRG